MKNSKPKELIDYVEWYKENLKKDAAKAKTMKEALLLIKQTSNEENIRVIANKALRLNNE